MKVCSAVRVVLSEADAIVAPLTLIDSCAAAVALTVKVIFVGEDITSFWESQVKSIWKPCSSTGMSMSEPLAVLPCFEPSAVRNTTAMYFTVSDASLIPKYVRMSPIDRVYLFGDTNLRRFFSVLAVWLLPDSGQGVTTYFQSLVPVLLDVITPIWAYTSIEGVRFFNAPLPSGDAAL